MSVGCRCFFEILILILLDNGPEADLLDCMVGLFFIFSETSRMFSTKAALIHIPTSSAQAFQVLHVLINT